MSQPAPIRIGFFAVQVLQDIAERSHLAQVVLLHDLAHGIRPPVPLVPSAMDEIQAYCEGRMAVLAAEGVDPTANDLAGYWQAVQAGTGFESAVQSLVEQDDPKNPPAPSPS